MFMHAWGTLLAGCRVHHKNIELGEEVLKKIQGIGPEGTGNFVLLSNIYRCENHAKGQRL
jgi:hypothetical protein